MALSQYRGVLESMTPELQKAPYCTHKAQHLYLIPVVPAAMHCHTLPRSASSLLVPHSHLLTCKVGPHRQPLRKFAVLSRATTSDTYRGRQKQTADASRQAEQLSQLAKEVFEVALQSGPRGFTRSMQAANAFASIGRYTMLTSRLSSTHYDCCFPYPDQFLSNTSVFAVAPKTSVVGAVSMPTAYGRGRLSPLRLS